MLGPDLADVHGYSAWSWFWCSFVFIVEVIAAFACVCFQDSPNVASRDVVLFQIDSKLRVYKCPASTQGLELHVAIASWCLWHGVQKQLLRKLRMFLLSCRKASRGSSTPCCSALFYVLMFVLPVHDFSLRLLV